MIKVPASVRVRRWCWQLLVSQAKQCLEQTFKQTHQHWCCWWFLKGLQCSSSCSFFMFWYYNILIIASYIVKDHVRSWEGRWAGGGAMKWNEFSGRDSGDTGEKKCSKPQAASRLSCMGTHMWSSSLLNRSVAEWVTKNKTTATQKPDILWVLKQGLKGWVAKWHPVSPINLKSSEAKNIF